MQLRGAGAERNIFCSTTMHTAILIILISFLGDYSLAFVSSSLWWLTSIFVNYLLVICSHYLVKYTIKSPHQHVIKLPFFRTSDESFVELSRGAQSGGEKSVSTAVYMMALQASGSGPKIVFFESRPPRPPRHFLWFSSVAGPPRKVRHICT